MSRIETHGAMPKSAFAKPDKQYKRIPHESAKHRRGQVEWARITDIVIAKQFGRCVVFPERSATCGHHRRARSQGGANIEANCAGVSDEGHAWIHTHPEEAHKLGLIVVRGDAEYAQLGRSKFGEARP